MVCGRFFIWYPLRVRNKFRTDVVRGHNTTMSMGYEPLRSRLHATRIPRITT